MGTTTAQDYIFGVALKKNTYNDKQFVFYSRSS